MNLRKWIALVLVLFVGWIVVREVQDAASKRRAYPIIVQLGGKIRSLPSPIPFTGSELWVVFDQKKFTNEELHQLAFLNPLTSKHIVGVMFQDTNITGNQIRMLREQVPDCEIKRFIGGEPLDDHSDSEEATSE